MQEKCCRWNVISLTISFVVFLIYIFFSRVSYLLHASVITNNPCKQKQKKKIKFLIYFLFYFSQRILMFRSRHVKGKFEECVRNNNNSSDTSHSYSAINHIAHQITCSNNNSSDRHRIECSHNDQ